MSSRKSSSKLASVASSSSSGIELTGVGFAMDGTSRIRIRERVGRLAFFDFFFPFALDVADIWRPVLFFVSGDAPQEKKKHQSQRTGHTVTTKV